MILAIIKEIWPVLAVVAALLIGVFIKRSNGMTK